MDKNLFTEHSPGIIREVPMGDERLDWAFIPQEMPLEWEFPVNLWPLLAEAKEAAGKLDGIGQTLQEPDLLLRPLQDRESITSSNIEGTFVTPEQLLLFGLSPDSPDSQSEARSKWREVYNYGCALKQGRELLDEIPFCNRYIQAIHKTLMAGASSSYAIPGCFRTLQVQLGFNARFVPSPPKEVQRLMDDLEIYMNKGDDRFDPLVQCFIVHYQFETIHPFKDGNGRVGRVLLALMIFTHMKHTMPWLYLSAYFERYKEEYYQKLFNVSAKGDWSSWVEFCLKGVIEQANDSIKRCSEFNTLKEELHRRVKKHSKRTHRIIEGLFKYPILTIPAVAKQFKVGYPTAKKDVYRLLESNVIRKLEGHYPETFFSHEIINISHSD